jgi:hypothetical protein
MFLEREEMSKNDYDAPFVVDTRTDKEIEDSLSIGDHSQVSRTSAGGKSIGGENLQSSVNGGSESVTNGLDNVVKKKGWSLF